MGLAWAAAWLLPSMIGGSIRVGEIELEHIGGALVDSPADSCLCSSLASHLAVAGLVRAFRSRARLVCGAVSGAIIGMLPS